MGVFTLSNLNMIDGQTDGPIDGRTDKASSQLKKNKAGYTANTSCGRVGRGGNARFHTFRLVFTDGRTDRPTDGRTKALLELRVRN